MVRIYAVSGRGSGKLQTLKEIANMNTRLHQEDDINTIGHRLVLTIGAAHLEYDREEVLAENEKTFRKFINQKNRKKNKR